MIRLTLATLLVLPAFAQHGVHLLHVEPTALFPRATPLRQVAIVTLLNDSAVSVTGHLTARVVGGESGPAATVNVSAGVSRQRVLVPDVQKATDVEFSLRVEGSGNLLLQKSLAWEPQRKWKVYVVKSSHEDLGYESYIFHKQREIADFIDLAAGIASHRENLSDLERSVDARYHYTMESLLFHRNYVEERGLTAWRTLVDKHVRSAELNLMGAPSGVHSHWMDYEELARMTYPCRREMRDRYDLDLKTFMIVDNPSLSWSGAQAVADAGFKYVARWGQGWRTGGNNNYATTKLPPLFWWKAPNGHHRVLFGWRTHYGIGFWYGQAGGGYSHLIDKADEHVSSQLKMIESGAELGPYPYDAVVNPEYIDHDIPRFDTRVLPEWTRRYAYPEIRISGPTQFFEYIEEKYGPALPELSGDLNNFSADYATIDPESQGSKWKVARLLPLTESVGALASVFTPGYLLLPSFVDRTYTRLFDYDEHSWPTLPPASDVQLFNASWVKKHEAKRALDNTEAAWRDASAAFARNVSTTGPDTVAIFNALAHPRTDLVSLPRDTTSVVDLATGKRIPVQQIAGASTFLAPGVPALGYKLFRLENKGAEVKEAATVSAAPDGIANEFYELRFDTQTGAIRSIKEKWSGRELVDAQAPYKLNQFVYVHKNAREAKDGFTHTPAKARKQQGSIGPVAAQFKVWIDDDKTGAAIEQTTTLYAGLKRIDIVNRIEHARSLFTTSHDERYRENIYFAFPFKVDEGQFRVEYPGGVVRPYLDQLRWGSHDYLYANRWVDVSNASHGITLAPWNAGTFSFGEIRYNQFSIDYKPQGSHLYSYAWSNRMSGLLTLGPEDVNATVGYSLTSHDGDWNSGSATQFGWSTASPLRAIVLPANQHGTWNEPAREFLSVSRRNVQLTVLKAAAQPGRGLVARFVETEGQSGEFDLNLSALGATRAYLTNLVEDDLESLPVSEGRVKVRIRHFSFATVRFDSTKPSPASAEPPKLTAQATGDDAIQLTWTGAAAPAWNIYRSVDPKDPAVGSTLVARVTTPNYVDRGLHYKTRYYYRVAPVSAHNGQGPISNLVDVETTGPNKTPPATVDELGVIRRAKDKLMVYWRSNTEPDVARYHLYRGGSPDFALAGAKPLATLTPARYFLQLYVDDGLTPGQTYFYKVVAEDWAGNRQSVSPVGSATTPRQ